MRAIEALQAEWDRFATQMISRKQNGENVSDTVSEGRGKQLVDAIREQYRTFINMERQLRHERNEKANSTAIFTISLYLLFSLTFAGALAYFGRRELVALSSTYGESSPSSVPTASTSPSSAGWGTARRPCRSACSASSRCR